MSLGSKPHLAVTCVSNIELLLTIWSWVSHHFDWQGAQCEQGSGSYIFILEVTLASTATAG